MSKKVVLLGDSAVGKTSLIKRFVKDMFDDSYIVTIGSKVSKKQLTVTQGGKEIRLNIMIWDVIGTRGFTSLHARTFAGVHGAILVTDMTRKETLDSLERYWIPTLLTVVESVPMVFACNKADLTDRYAFEKKDLTQLTSKYNIGLEGALPPNLSTCYSTSAKAGDNVDKLFESLAYMMTSEKIVEDPIKELFESMVATGVSRTSDKSTLIGALDAIFVDFAEGWEDEKSAMSTIRKETLRAGIDVRSPTKEGLFKLVEYLAETESERFKQGKVESNKEKRMQWASAAK